MNVRLRLAATLLSLLMPALLLARWSLAIRTPVGPISTPALPSQAGSWMATRDERLEPEALAIIAPDAHILRLYEAPGRTPIWIYVGVYGGRAGYAGGAHDPEVCYPAFGWEVLASRLVEIPLDGRDRMHATLLKVHIGNRSEAVLYWFQPAGRWSAPGAVEQLTRIWDAATGRPQYAFVRLSGPSKGGLTAERDLAAFARAIAPALRAAVDGIQVMPAGGSLGGLP